VEAQLTTAIEKAASEHWMQLVTTFADLRDLQGRHADSINIYRQMLAKDPLNVTALNNLAWLLSYQSQDHAEAQKLVEQAISLFGPIGPLLDTRGMIFLRRGDTKKALKDLRQAVEEIPGAAIYFHLAQAELAAGNKAAAEAAFRDAQTKNLDPITDLHILEAGDYQPLADMFK
jgi:tetratricopeptide (TPR) repeat protein